MNDEKTKVGLFKFGLISPILHSQVRGQNEYCKELSRTTYDVPGLGRRKYKWETFKGWLKVYRRDGFDGLVPRYRCDKGLSRRLNENQQEMLKGYLRENSFVSYAYLYRDLVRLGLIKSYEISYQSLKEYIRQAGFLADQSAKIGRKRFEYANINDLWICDFMHFPKIKGKKKHYLCAIIDDHSRLIVGSRVDVHENSHSVGQTLKNAILQYGLPKRFYCDNGPAFISSHLQEVCAHLMVALLHSKPYDPASRGKIERFMRTVRQKFIPDADLNVNVEAVNQQFSDWIQNDYNIHPHSTLKMAPKERYFNNLETVSPERVPPEALELIFFETIRRKVNKDSTVSINKEIYEVPSMYAGETIEIRYQKPGEYYIFKENKPNHRLLILNANENAIFNTLRFKEMEDEDV